MALFRRNNKQEVMPSEVQDYYQGERRDRVGVAWVLAILSLIVTVALVLLVFYGGRWVWNRISDDNEEATSTDTSRTEQSTNDSSISVEEPAQNSDQPTTTNNPDQSVSSDSSDVTSSNSDNSSTSQSLSEPGELSNTGAGDLVLPFAVIAAAGYLLNIFRLKKKSINS